MLDVAKQLVTIASGFLVISVALLKVLLPNENGQLIAFWMIIGCWISIILSLACGFLAFGSVANTAHANSKYDIEAKWTKFFLQGQQILFALAFILFVWFVIENI